MELNPSYYNLQARTQLIQLSMQRIGIGMVRKSRIIQKDALRIIEISTLIRAVNPQLDIALVCSRAICSKSIQLLQNCSISIDYVDL